MLGASVDLELGALLAAEGGLGEHALDGVLDDALGVLLHGLAEALELEAAEIAGVSRKTGYNIQDAWNEGGMDGIIPHFSSGPMPRLSEQDVLEIESHLEANPMDASRLRAYILKNYGEDFTEKHIRNMFMGRGLRYSKDLR